MRKPLKLFAMILGIAATAFIALIVAVVLIVDPDDYRPLVVDAVERSTGRSLELPGELGLRVLPCCSVTLGQARLGNPAGFPEPAFASIEGAALSLRLWPLLTRREVEIGAVRLEGLDLELIRRADGQVNWEFATGDTDAAATTGDGTAMAGLRSGAVEVSGATVRYRDLQSGQAYTVTDAQLAVDRIDYGDRLMVAAPALALRLSGTGLPAQGIDLALVAAHVEFATDDAGMSALDVPDLKLQVDGTSLTGSLKLDESTGGMLQFDLVLDRLDLDRYTTPASAPAAAPARAATTRLPLDALADLSAQGSLRIASFSGAGLDVRDIVLQLDSASGPVDIALSGRLHDGRFALTGAGNTAARQPRLTGRIEFEDLVPRRLLDGAIETADPNVLGHLAGTADWRLEPTSLALEEVDWQLDDTRVRGRLAIEDFDRMATRFDLAIDRMDLDRYLPPATDAASGSDAATTRTTDIPVDTIRSLDLQGRLRADRLTVMRFGLGDVRAEVRAAGGVLRLAPLAATLYGGTYQGALTLDATDDVARLSLEQSVASIEIGDLLRNRFGSDLLSGSLSMALAGSARGASVPDLLRGLSGNLDLNLADGVYRGADLLYELRRAQALFRNEAAPAEPANRETPIRALSIVGTIVDGVLQSDRIRLDTPYLKIGGKGGFDLVDLLLDYRLDAEIPRAIEGAGGDNLANLLGSSIPLTLSGPVSGPRVGIDLKSLVTGRARETLEQRARDVLLDRLGGNRTQAPPGEAGTESAPADTAAETAAGTRDAQREPSTRDLLKRGLRDLLAPKPDADSP